MTPSAWTVTSKMPSFQRLNKNISTDILIIGGGITGLLCAYFLQQKGVDYALIEGNTIGSGITKNTTAKITAQHGLIYHQLAKKMGFEKARLYLKANEQALAKYQELCQTIPCDFVEKNAFVYSLHNGTLIENELATLAKLGFSAQFTDQLPLPFSIAGAITFPHQGQFNPLKFLASLAKDLHIYENTFATTVDDHTVTTANGRITANKIIVATHFPFMNTHGSYFLKMYQHRSYVIALENAPNVDGMYVDEAEKGMSFRNYNDLLLIGGGDHRTGKNGGNWRELREFAQKYYPNAKEKYAWATQDCMTLDGIPYIGHYSKNTPNWYVATGFNKWGMTSAMVSAMILSDLVTNQPNEFAPVFSPHRNMLKPQLLVNGFEATVNLLTPSTKRCPHLGCALKWNKVEHSWDCPCHGSRFAENGQLIDNPATGSLKIKKR